MQPNNPHSHYALILQPDAEMYGACRSLLNTLKAAGKTAPVRACVVFPFDGPAVSAYEAAGFETLIEPRLAVLRRSSANFGGIAALVANMVVSGYRLARIIRRRGITLVHTNSITITTGVVAHRLARVPHVWQLRECPREGGVFRKALRALMRGRRLVAAPISDAASGIVPKSTIVVKVPNGYVRSGESTNSPGRSALKGAQAFEDLGDLPTANSSEQQIAVGMVARISETKGQALLLNAVAQLPSELKSRISVYFAGTTFRGERRVAEDLLVLSRELNVPFCAVGFIEDVERFYEMIDLLVVCTKTGEGFCMTALEAMMNRVPVVSAATGGIEDLVRDRKTGLVAAPDDSRALAAALQSLVEDSQLRNSIVDEAHVHAQKWSIDASGEALLSAWGVAR